MKKIFNSTPQNYIPVVRFQSFAIKTGIYTPRMLQTCDYSLWIGSGLANKLNPILEL